ncbi:hypothetical protein BH11MYX3_BH11MYX3_08680 [soil metagenome]
MIRALILATILAAAPAHAEMMCMSGPLSPQPIASARNQVAGSGGVIVASGGQLPDWRFRALNRIVRAHVVVIAPGLAIYHPPPLPGTDVTLEDQNHRAILRAERALTIEEPSAAPQIASIKTAPEKVRRAVHAQLSEKPPAHAVVVIVSRQRGEQLVPIAWAQIPGNRPTVLDLWHTPGSCEEYVTTWVEPLAGDRVVLSWVDDAGRISEPSKLVTIGKGS